MKKALLNIVTYSMLGIGILSTTYMALPVEYQAMIPNVNWLTALIVGGSGATLGSASLYFQKVLGDNKKITDEKVNLLVENFLTLKESYNEVRNELKELKSSYTSLTSAVKENSALIKVDLKAKLSNPLIDAKVEDLIRGALNETE